MLTTSDTAAVATFITAARTLVKGHLAALNTAGSTHPLSADIVIGNHRLVITYNGALYCVIIIDLLRTPGVIAVEWDSAVSTAVEEIARKFGVPAAA